MSEAEIFAAAERRTADELSALGFSEAFVARFFRPFLGGIFLDASLSTTSRMLYFVYKMLSSGDITLPAAGMQAIPDQLAARLPEGTIRCETRVAAIERVEGRAAGVRLATGERQPASAVVVATDVAQAAALTGLSDVPAPRSVICVYFSAPVSPVRGPLLVLDGEGRGPVLNLAALSNVAPGYAPAGQHLISTTIVGALEASDAVVERDVRGQMTEWFGAATVRGWRHLRTYRIPWAQFDQSPGRLDPAERDVRLGEGVYVCGDHREQASINGALHAGRRAADAVLADAGAVAR
jgi:protoporphyrinogen oxidase